MEIIAFDPATLILIALCVGSVSLVLFLLSVTEGWFSGTPIVRSVM